jgi:D-alanyl-lipoteichoic acid acyltransferase DltB (MBOAT superfamily)
MSNVVATGNKIGQTIAFTRMLGGFCLASCVCSFAGLIMKDEKTDKSKKLRSVMTLVAVATLIMLLSYFQYTVTKSFKGMGSLVAANAAIGAAFG